MSINAPGNYGPETCASCGGSGKPNRQESMKYCRFCNGQGSVMVAQPSKQCPQCNGTGDPEPGSSSNYCRFCAGTGWALRWKEKQ